MEVFTSKVNCPRVSRGEGGIPSERESSFAQPEPVPEEEHILATELVRVAPLGTPSLRVIQGLLSSALQPLPLLWMEPTSGCSLRSVSTLSELLPSRRSNFPFCDPWSLGKAGRRSSSVCSEEKTSSSSIRDQRLLSLWKVQRPLIAQGSSSSESSL